MSFVKYEGLGTSKMVLQKMRDYIHQEGYTIVEDMVDDLDIFDRNKVDGKRLVFKDKTNNYFICMRNANGYQIFPEMAGGIANPEGKTIPTTKNSSFNGIGVIASEGYSPTNRWYDQYNAPKKFNSNTVVGSAIKMAGETPALTILPPIKANPINTNITGALGRPLVQNVDYNVTANGQMDQRHFERTISTSALFMMYKKGQDCIKFIDANGNDVIYNADTDVFSFDFDYYIDLAYYCSDAYLNKLKTDVQALWNSGIRYGDLIFPMDIKNKKDGSILATIDYGILVQITGDTGTIYDVSYLGNRKLTGGYVVSKGKLISEVIQTDPYFRYYKDFNINLFSTFGTFPPTTRKIRFVNHAYGGVYNASGSGVLNGLTFYQAYDNNNQQTPFSPNFWNATNRIQTLEKDMNNYLQTNNPLTGRLQMSNNPAQVEFLNPSTLYCNHITEPTDTLTFTLVDSDHKIYQHLVIGNVKKYANWTGGIFISGSQNSYTMSKYEYSSLNDNFKDILPVLGVTSKGASTFVRMNIDNAPKVRKIFWASSGKPDITDPRQCYTGKQLATPLRFDEGLTPIPVPNWEGNKSYGAATRVDVNGNLYACKSTHTSSTSFNNDLTSGYWEIVIGGVTGDWKPMIPHYGYLQSRSAKDSGVNCNTLNCITLNLPLYFAVKVDPDSLNNFAPIGEVSGVYFVSMYNMADGKLYEISYPTSGNLHQVFSIQKRRGTYGFDGISIKQEDNS